MATRKSRARVELRMRLVPTDAEPIGPGKIAILESIGRNGSISAAAREHAMSYSRAWKLISEINEAFDEPLVMKSVGGTTGGGAVLTQRALALIAEYRAIERDACAEAGKRLAAVLRSMKDG